MSDLFDKELFDLNKMTTTELIQKRAELVEIAKLANDFRDDIEEHLLNTHPDGVVEKGAEDILWRGKGKVTLHLNWNIKNTTIDTAKLKADGLYNKYAKHGVRKKWTSIH